MTDYSFTPDHRDLIRQRAARFVLWQLPLIVFVGGSFGGSAWHTILWTAALTVAGTGCVANAVRCARLHCFFTGPFLLLAAVVTLTYGLGVLPLGPRRWTPIGVMVAVGTLLFRYVPEWIGGKYVTRARPAGG